MKEGEGTSGKETGNSGDTKNSDEIRRIIGYLSSGKIKEASRIILEMESQNIKIDYSASEIREAFQNGFCLCLLQGMISDAISILEYAERRSVPLDTLGFVPACRKRLQSLLSQHSEKFEDARIHEIFVVKEYRDDLVDERTLHSDFLRKYPDHKNEEDYQYYRGFGRCITEVGVIVYLAKQKNIKIDLSSSPEVIEEFQQAFEICLDRGYLDLAEHVKMIADDEGVQIDWSKPVIGEALERILKTRKGDPQVRFIVESLEETMMGVVGKVLGVKEEKGREN